MITVIISLGIFGLLGIMVYAINRQYNVRAGGKFWGTAFFFEATDRKEPVNQPLDLTRLLGLTANPQTQPAPSDAPTPKLIAAVETPKPSS